MFKYLIKKSWPLLTFCAVLSVVGGLLSVRLLALITEVITVSSETSKAQLGVQFAATALAAMLFQSTAQILLERLGQRVHAQLRNYIVDHVNAADFRSLETMGRGRMQAAMSEHTLNVKFFFGFMPIMLTNAAIVLGCLIYMASLSWEIFLFASAVIGAGFLTFQLAGLRAVKHLQRAEYEQDRMLGIFNALINGAKELRLNAGKRDRFLRSHMRDSIEQVRRERSLGMTIYIVSSVWNNFLIFVFIGLVLFVLTESASEQVRVTTGFALLLVYMVGPLEAVINSLPPMKSAGMSARHIESMVAGLTQSEHMAEQAGPQQVRSLVLRGVTHQYYHEGTNDVFTLGPIDLSFAPGQLNYLVGGNGSGKTSLAKLLVGLYKPENGTIELNGQKIDDDNRDKYRQMFSAIFSDFHLFDSLLDSVSSGFDERGNALLTKLNLHHKVQIKEGAFTTQALSQGQRKRLALVAAYLEDRPFLVFDEWAADQDPVFKDVFYHELLPELKAMGKTVLVISHDDRYFHLADRLIKMESGRIVPDAETGR
ncbi:cyclic peptide export ABC transporter [Alcaligenes sp. SDU_A2]|uniref:cyclic peptide export ABC transporter n=1 Tax=Alcaligenes sp. SDU_A2 TaxID=3136634 RepID=UPI0031205312